MLSTGKQVPTVVYNTVCVRVAGEKRLPLQRGLYYDPAQTHVTGSWPV